MRLKPEKGEKLLKNGGNDCESMVKMKMRISANCENFHNL